MITIFGWFGYDIPVRERYHLIKQAGFDGVLIWWSENVYCPGFRSLPDLARNEGLYVENIHAPYEGITNLWLDNLEGEDVTDRLIGCVEDCYIHEIPTMVVHPTSGTAPSPNDTGLDRIKRIVERAEKRRVNVAFENLRRTEYLQYVLGHIDSERLGFCFDSGHHHCRTPEQDLLSMNGSRLMALHLHDNAGYIKGDSPEDEHKMPFDGTIDWPTTMKKIADAGYTGATTLEIDFRYENLKADEFLKIAFSRAMRLEELRAQNDTRPKTD